MKGCAVANTMRVQTLLFQCWHFTSRLLNVFAHDKPHTKTSEIGSPMIPEHRFRPRRIDPRFFQMLSQQSGSFWPKRGDSFFSAFATQQHTGRDRQLQVGRLEAHDFADARARVEQQRQQYKIAAAVRRRTIDRLQDRLDFGELQVLNLAHLRALEGDAKDSLRLVQVFRMFISQISKEAMDRAEPNVARASLVLSAHLQVLEKGQGLFAGQLFNSKGVGILLLARDKPQE